MNLEKRSLRGLTSALAALILPGLLSFPSYGQSDDGTLLQKFRENFKKDYLSIGLLLQTRGDFQIRRSFGGNNGFSIGNMRVNLKGKLDEGFGYFLQANFINSPAILDARLSYEVSPQLGIDAGLFKSPFSHEYLTGAASLDLIGRSQVVNALAPKRQIGVQLRGPLGGSGKTSYAAGIFNGNGYGGNDNDNGAFLVTGRIAAKLQPGSASQEKGLEIGGNIAFSKDDGLRFSGIAGGARFSGDRVLYGGDLRYTNGKWLLAGEIIGSNFDGSFGSTVADVDPYGFHATAGYNLSRRSQVLARFDSFRSGGTQDDSDFLIFGLNLWPTEATKLQLNYLIDTDQSEIKHHQVLLNGQVAL